VARNSSGVPGTSPVSSEAYDAIYAVVSLIPRGRVATYGQIADIAGLPRRARMVGYAMRELPEGSDLPWHRVVSASGEISSRGCPSSEREQRQLLEAEGVTFGRGGRLSLSRYRWNPDNEDRYARNR
jgi:methylated-DNA-protein-cysteine methyltransferase-like protein